jgi:Phytanoyl-CoA dioxygenase (PhyH)
VLLPADIRMNNVYIVRGALSSNETQCFGAECDILRKTIGNCDLSELGCSLDVFENSVLNDNHRARYDPDAYFRERWHENVPKENDAEAMRNFLLRKLPSIISKIHSCEKLHIFNESYIVKEPGSQIAFRWHTDANEQLAAVFPPHRSEYFSAWCPLDRATAENGTIAFPNDTSIIELQMNNSPASNAYNSSSFNSITDDSEENNICPSEDDSGLMLTVEIGAIVIFSSNTWHRSGQNSSLRTRRVLYIQYSPIVISTSASPEVEQLDSCVRSNSEEHSKSTQSTEKNSDSDRHSSIPLSFAIPCVLDVSSVELLYNDFNEMKLNGNHKMKKKRDRDT